MLAKTTPATLEPLRPSDALFLDVDGTLIEIAEHPDAVTVPSDLISTLQRLQDRQGGALALISGRTIAKLDELFTPLHLRAAGLHGAEIRLHPIDAIQHAPISLAMHRLHSDIFALKTDFPELVLEDKGNTFAIHYRARPDIRDQLMTRIAALIGKAGSSLMIQPGKMVFEIKTAETSKGQAIEQFLQLPLFQNRRPVFCGDDLTDLSGFHIVQEHAGLALPIGDVGPMAAAFPNSATCRAWLLNSLQSNKS